MPLFMLKGLAIDKGNVKLLENLILEFCNVDLAEVSPLSNDTRYLMKESFNFSKQWRNYSGAVPFPLRGILKAPTK